MKPTLLVLAAGMGSRYGGLKQIDPVGLNDETILEFSVYDAIKAGDDAIIGEMKKIAEIRAGQFAELNEKITRLEKWRWMVVGGAMAAGYGLSLFFNLLKYIH